MTRYTMTIDGAEAPAASTFPVHDPASGQVYAEAPECTTAQLDEAVAAAGRAFGSWAADEAARRRALVAIGEQLRASVEPLAATITAEQGKPRREATAEVTFASQWFDYYAEVDVAHETVADDERRRIEIGYRPLGVVAAITPWNFPLSSVCWKLAPALRAGDTVVLKPSPYTPLTALALGELLRPLLPPGVVNVVSGGDELGAALVTHPGHRRISVTGSVDTGKLVASAAVADLKRTTLELGGNDPAILLDDVDPQRIGKRLFWGAFYNCGQICTAVKRVYVPDRLYGDVVEVLGELARTTPVGDGTAADSRIGPVNNPAQRDRVIELVDDALAAGATAAAGGRRGDGDGYFVEPTVLADAADGMRIVDEEQFGPALPIVRYTDLEDALAAANGTRYGLGASIWTADRDRALALAGQLDCGTVWINGHNALPPEQPFGGHKWSGIGMENGRLGLLEYLEPVVVHELRG